MYNTIKGPNETKLICKTIISLLEAQQLICDNLTAKNDKIETLLEPCLKITDAIKEQIKILECEYEYGIIEVNF